MFRLYTNSRFFTGDTFWQRSRRRATLLNGLAAHWTLNEPSGTRYDSVGASNLAPHGSVGQVEGVLGYAAQFAPATSDYLGCASRPALRLAGDFTIAGWVFFDAVDPAGLIAKWEPGSLEYMVACDGTSLAFSVSANGATPASVTGAEILESGAWYLFTAWHDSAAQSLNLSINNAAHASVSHAGGVFAGAADFSLGRNAVAGTFLAGRLDSVSLWSRLLTTTERARLYNSGLGLAYPF